MASEGQDRAHALGWGIGVTSTDLRPSPAPPPAPPYHKKLQMFLFTTKRAGAQCESPDPMREADAPSTGECTHIECARPTEDSHTRTTRDSAQRGEDAKRRPRCIVCTSAAQLVRRSDRDGGGMPRPDPKQNRPLRIVM